MSIFRVRKSWFSYRRYEHPFRLQVSHYLTIAGRTYHWSSHG